MRTNERALTVFSPYIASVAEINNGEGRLRLLVGDTMMHPVSHCTKTPVLAVFVASEDTEPTEDRNVSVKTSRGQPNCKYVDLRYALSPRYRVADGIPGTIRAMRTDKPNSSLHALR